MNLESRPNGPIIRGMSNAPLTPSDRVELMRLYGEHERATLHAAVVLRQFGMQSPQFFQAERVTGDLWQRIRAIQGVAGKPWNA